MADNLLQIPTDLTNIYTLKENSEPLRKFLTELLNEVKDLRKRVVQLETEA